MADNLAGHQAGVLQTLDERAQLLYGGEPAITYATHTKPGTVLTAPDTI